jgi:hypothetical protein
LAAAAATRLEQPFWTRAWFWAGLALLATVPFLVADIPPLADFPGHVGRYHVMLDVGRSPYLQRFYGFRWTLVGNLGADLLMLAVGPVLGAERGAWAIAALTPALMVLGIFAVSRAVHGRVQPTAFLALPFVYASAFERGFLNYDLAVSLALLALALWIGWSARPWLRAAVFVPLAFGIWVCHAAGWGLLGLFIGGYELQAAIRAQGWRLAAVGMAILRLLPLTPPALLNVGTISRGAPAAVVAASTPHSFAGLALYKVSFFFDQLHDRLHLLDAASVLLLLALFLFARSRAASVSPALGVSAALVGLVLILMPPTAAGIALADFRLAPVAVIVFILSIRAESMRGASLIVASALALTGLRLAVTAYGWDADAKAYQRHLSALQWTPMGARILALVPNEGAAAPYTALPMGHLADLAIVRRDALVNSEWTIAGANLLQVKANADIAYHIDPSQFVVPDKVGQALATAPLDHFDYVWVLGRYPAAATPKDLAPVYADEETRLFRIIR